MRQQPKAAMTQERDQRYEFGENWHRFVRQNFTPDNIGIAQRHILDFLDRADLADLCILDIGCGSGLHALAMITAGAACVHAFDYDPQSVAACRYIRNQAGQPKTWTAETASVLDDAYMESLPRFDLVYSWGRVAPHRRRLACNAQRGEESQAGLPTLYRPVLRGRSDRAELRVLAPCEATLCNRWPGHSSLDGTVVYLAL